MALSIQAQVIAAIVSLLGQTGAPATVYRTRVEPFGPEDIPAINVFPGEEAPDYRDAGNDEYRLTWQVRVECIVTAAGEVDLAADPLRVWVQQQLMKDITLGQLVEGCTIKSVTWEIPENRADVDVIFQVLTFEIKFATALGDPTVSASYGG